jgi:hypothetical protein
MVQDNPGNLVDSDYIWDPRTHFMSQTHTGVEGLLMKLETLARQLRGISHEIDILNGKLLNLLKED